MHSWLSVLHVPSCSIPLAAICLIPAENSKRNLKVLTRYFCALPFLSKFIEPNRVKIDLRATKIQPPCHHEVVFSLFPAPTALDGRL